jgi:hypothetical protein
MYGLINSCRERESNGRGGLFPSGLGLDVQLAAGGRRRKYVSVLPLLLLHVRGGGLMNGSSKFHPPRDPLLKRGSRGGSKWVKLGCASWRSREK